MNRLNMMLVLAMVSAAVTAAGCAEGDGPGEAPAPEEAEAPADEALDPCALAPEACGSVGRPALEPKPCSVTTNGEKC